MAEIIQPSFAKGELSPALFGRVDTAAFQVGLAKALNCIIHTFGGVSRRPGTRFIGPVADHGVTPRLIEFQFKTTDKYILEFGDMYMRVIRDDGHVLFVRDHDITGATQANPVVITAPNHTFVNDMIVEITNVVGMTELNGNQYTVANVSGDTFELSGVDGTGFTAYTSGGEATQRANITAISNANPVAITIPAHGFVENDEVFISGVGGTTELNNNRYYIANVTANTFELTNQITGANIDGTAFGVFTSGGTVARVFEIVTPYRAADLFELNFTQSADVMTIVHRNYRIRRLSRRDNDDWTLEELELGPSIDSPADVDFTVNTAGSDVDRYQVTALDRETNEESLPGLSDLERTITAATQADPVVVTTSAAHGYVTGDEVQIDNVVGMTELNGVRFVVSNETATTFELTTVAGDNIDGTNFTAYVSGGIVRTNFIELSQGAAKDATITWTAVSGAGRYAIYRRRNGIYGVIGETELTTFDDNNIVPDTAEAPPTARDPFFNDDDQPGAVGFFEQRLVFGGSLNGPDTTEYSQTGNQTNFNKSQPLRQDDAFDATLNSQQVNEIRHYITQNDLLVFTSGSEWRVNSGPDAAFGFDTIKQKPQTYWGSSFIRPLIIGNTILYITEDNANVRSFGFSLQLDGYTGSNLNILSQHLLLGHTLLDWSHVRIPESRLYMVRDDGDLLSLSFDQEQEVIAWAPWETSGEFQATASLRGGGAEGEDSTYFVVKRTVNGLTVRYIEVARQRFIDDVRDAFFVDSGLSLDNPVAISNVSLTNPVVITATAHGFSDGDEVDIFDIRWVPNIDSKGNETQPDQLNRRRYTVQNSTTDTFEVNVDGTAFNGYVNNGTARKAVSTVTGLEHLEGRAVACLADGNVISNLTVSNASVTLPRKFSRIHIGLPYTTDIETLNLEAPQGTIQGYDKHIPKVVIRFYKSRGLLVGTRSDQLVAIKQRENEAYGDPTALLTGDKEVRLFSNNTVEGRIFMRQRDPLPTTILAVVPSVEVGED